MIHISVFSLIFSYFLSFSLNSYGHSAHEYTTLNDNQTQGNWQLVWKIQAPPKIK